MKKTEVKRFASLYERHLQLLKLQERVKAPLMRILEQFEGYEIIMTVAPMNSQRSNWKTLSVILSSHIHGVL
jgi:hypothetical protein